MCFLSGTFCTPNFGVILRRLVWLPSEVSMLSNTYYTSGRVSQQIKSYTSLTDSMLFLPCFLFSSLWNDSVTLLSEPFLQAREPHPHFPHLSSWDLRTKNNPKYSKQRDNVKKKEHETINNMRNHTFIQLQIPPEGVLYTRHSVRIIYLRIKIILKCAHTLCFSSVLPSCLSPFFIISIPSASPSQTLHAHYVLEVLYEARRVLKQMPNFSHVTTFPSKEVTICGKFQSRVGTLIFRSLVVLRHLPNLKTMEIGLC